MSQSADEVQLEELQKRVMLRAVLKDICEIELDLFYLSLLTRGSDEEQEEEGEVEEQGEGQAEEEEAELEQVEQVEEEEEEGQADAEQVEEEFGMVVDQEEEAGEEAEHVEEEVAEMLVDEDEEVIPEVEVPIKHDQIPQTPEHAEKVAHLINAGTLVPRAPNQNLVFPGVTEANGMKACNQPHCGYQTPARTRKGNTDDHARDKHLGQICYWTSIADDGGVTLCHTYAETAKQLLEHYMSKHVRPNIKKYWILQGGNRYMGYTCGWPGSPALHNKVPGRGDIGFTEPCRRIYKTRPSAERAARHRQFEIFCALHRGGWKAKHRKSLAAQEDVAPARKSDVAPAQKSEVVPAQMSDVAADEQAEAVEPNGQGDVSMRDVGEDSENEQGDVSMKDVGEDSNGESDGGQN